MNAIHWLRCNAGLSTAWLLPLRDSCSNGSCRTRAPIYREWSYGSTKGKREEKFTTKRENEEKEVNPRRKWQAQSVHVEIDGEGAVDRQIFPSRCGFLRGVRHFSGERRIRRAQP